MDDKQPTPQHDTDACATSNAVSVGTKRSREALGPAEEDPAAPSASSTPLPALTPVSPEEAALINELHCIDEGDWDGFDERFSSNLVEKAVVLGMAAREAGEDVPSEEALFFLACCSESSTVWKQLLQALLASQADSDPPEWLIHYSCQSGNAEAIKAVLEAGGVSQLENEDDNGNLPIHFVCQSGNAEAIKTVLEAGGVSQMEKKDPYFKYPIHHVCDSGNVEAIKTVLEAGGLIQLEKEDGFEKPSLVNLIDSVPSALPFVLEKASEEGALERMRETLMKGNWRKRLVSKYVEQHLASLVQLAQHDVLHEEDFKDLAALAIVKQALEAGRKKNAASA